MYDIAIVGGGLCGLALAEALEQRGTSVVLLEARQRLGGRILSQWSTRTGLAVDLGAGWFWPDAQPLFRELMERLELHSFPQHDSGAVLSLRDPEKGPEEIGNDPVHGGAQRITAGTNRVIASLAARLSTTDVRLGHRLTHVIDAGNHVQLRAQAGDDYVEIDARQLVLALPPRLVAANVTFHPPLPAETVSALIQTPTWMAASAKAVVCYEKGDWRDAGLSGSAFVTHEQAVLAELFDACDEIEKAAALGGFLALSPDQRVAFAGGLPMLIGNQIAQLFGPEYEDGELHYQDWATEPFTCCINDQLDDNHEHPRVADASLRQPHWQGRLHFGGSETAEHEPGYMEGALNAAQRIARTLALASIRSTAAASPTNAASIAMFRDWVDDQRAVAMTDYERRLSHRLTLQQRDQLTQIALLETVEAVFADALVQLERLDFDGSNIAVERGRSGLTPLIQEPFRTFLNDIVDDVLRFNGGSCALSNFPAEHRPSRDYMQTILRDLAAAWTAFSQDANQLLLQAHGAAGSPLATMPTAGVA